MVSDRVQRRIEALLDEADLGIAHSDWSLVKDRARNVLALDPNNTDGSTFLAAAERALAMDSGFPQSGGQLPISKSMPASTTLAPGFSSEDTRQEDVRRTGHKKRIMAIDDDPMVLRLIQRTLHEGGYDPLVISDSLILVDEVEAVRPDLLLIDLVLPGIGGFELVERIREFSKVPIIFITSRDTRDDAVHALTIGADDYIIKPFSPAELLARIGAVIRREASETHLPPQFVLDDLVINFPEGRVWVGGQEVVLSVTEYELLYQLATHAGQVLTHDQILQRVWGPEYLGEAVLVRSMIRHLRRRLGDDGRNPRFILNDPHVGYHIAKR